MAALSREPCAPGDGPGDEAGGDPGRAAVRVLLLEDGAADAASIAQALAGESLRCEVRAVRGRDEFLAALHAAAPDVILSDHAVPGYDGLEALADARAARPEVPFLFVSGAVSEERAIDWLRRGATDYVPRHRLERLAPVVRRALREGRERAERLRAAERATRLQAVTAALSAALSPDEVAKVCVEQGMAALGADTGACWLTEPGGRGLRLANARGYLPDWIERFARVAHGENTPVGDALRTGEPLWLSSREEYRARYPSVEAGTRGGNPGALAVAVVPLATAGQALGALAFTFWRARTFDPADRELMVAVARQCAQALERARLYEAEADVRRRLLLLASAGAVLASSLDYETTLQNIAALAMPLLGDFGFFDVVQPDGEVRRLARAHENPALEAALSATRWVRSEHPDMNLCALSTGEAALHPDIDESWLQRAAASPEHCAGMRALGFRSMLTVPLHSAGRTIGSLTLFFSTSGRSHTPDDLALAQELARRAATALEHAELYRQAQEANRLKDEFLATVSHELRTPMTAILGWSAILKGRVQDPAVRRGLDVIDRNARAQARLIEDVLDVSRIVAGKLQLERGSVDLSAVVGATVDGVAPAAQAKGVEIRAVLDPDAGFVPGDPDRIQQVVWNLATNAVKFTPEGGRVTVEVAREGTSVRLRVTDTGQGIPAEFLPHVFERFRQADSSTTRTHGGLGLGLAIARHLVELHGGTIRAESDGPGRGATFTVVLPAV